MVYDKVKGNSKFSRSGLDGDARSPRENAYC